MRISLSKKGKIVIFSYMYNVKKYWRFFETYSPSFNAVFGEDAKFVLTKNEVPFYYFNSTSNMYVCPLCLQKAIYRDNEFSQALSDSEIELKFTDDHYPPKSVRGIDKMLVCNDCNSNYGKEIDYAAKEYLMARLFLQGNKEIKFPLKITVPGLEGYSQAYGVWRKDVFDFQIVKSSSARLFTHLGQSPLMPGDQIKIKGTFPHKEVFARSMLKAAFLKCFEVFGYDFAYSETAYRLRQVINRQWSHPASHCLGVYFQLRDKPGRTRLYSSAIINNLKYYLVYFEISLEEYNHTETVFVIIPDNDLKSWKAMKALPIHEQGAFIESELIQVPDYVKSGVYFGYTGRTGPVSKDHHVSSLPE